MFYSVLFGTLLKDFTKKNDSVKKNMILTLKFVTKKMLSESFKTLPVSIFWCNFLNTVLKVLSVALKTQFPKKYLLSHSKNCHDEKTKTNI